MSSDAISVVRAFIAAINRHSLRELGELMSSDHTFVDSRGRAQTGREKMLAAWQGYFEMFPDYRVRAQHIVAEDRLVAVFGEASGTFKGRRGLVPQNRIVMPAAWQSRVRRGRVALWQVYADWTEGMKVIERETQNG